MQSLCALSCSSTYYSPLSRNQEVTTFGSETNFDLSNKVFAPNR